MQLLSYAFLFFVGSTAGWVIELLFRRFFTAKKWINPGFLTGPYLPLYGFGLCFLYFFSSLDITFISDNYWVDAILKIIVMGIMMTLIEYIAGIIFIKGMNIKLWDYSMRFGNIQGIICPLFSALWVICGAVYYFFINPSIVGVLAWFNNNIAFSFFVGVFFGVICIDFGYSINLSVKIRKIAKENKLIVSYEKLKLSIKNRLQAANHKSKFFSPFKTIENLKDSILKYAETFKDEVRSRGKKKKRVEEEKK